MLRSCNAPERWVEVIPGRYWRRSLVGPVLLLGIIGTTVLSSCSSSNDTDWIPATLVSTDGVCAGQRAMVPASGTIARSLTPAASQVTRTPTNDYVSLQVRAPDIFVYFSFAADLPAEPSTPVARDLLSYAYVMFDLKQPGDAGGSLTLLESSDLLHVSDFERFEVQGGQLVWRLVRSSPSHYWKRLTIYDDEPTNDPPPGQTCVVGDILGNCVCDFSGPELAVTLAGVTPL